MDLQVLAVASSGAAALSSSSLQKIDISDLVYVVNPGSYIGESTRREIAYAQAKGKNITYLEVSSG